jgi:hypothetical protein
MNSQLEWRTAALRWDINLVGAGLVYFRQWALAVETHIGPITVSFRPAHAPHHHVRAGLKAGTSGLAW